MYTHPFFEATPPGAAPGPPVNTGARVRHFRGCNKRRSVTQRSDCRYNDALKKVQELLPVQKKNQSTQIKTFFFSLTTPRGGITAPPPRRAQPLLLLPVYCIDPIPPTGGGGRKVRSCHCHIFRESSHDWSGKIGLVCLSLIRAGTGETRWLARAHRFCWGAALHVSPGPCSFDNVPMRP